MKVIGKKKIIIIAAAAVLLIAVLLFPFESTLRDGGTKSYTPMTRVYTVYDYCGHGYSDNVKTANYGRHTVYILGQMVYNDAGLPI